MRRALPLAFLLAALPAGAAPAPDDALVAAGKQRAAQSGIRWEVRDVVHPKLGSIRVAIALNAITLQTKTDKIVSSVYVSCEKATGSIAIELVNAPSSDFTRGLGPKALPRLACIAPNGTRTDVAAKWEANELGDVMARGLAPAALRRCASLEILQNISTPPGWTRDGQPFAVEISPYGHETDEVFGDCGEPTVYAAELPVNRAQTPVRPPAASMPAPAPAQAAPVVQAAAPPASAPTAPPPPPPAADANWQRARTVDKGKSNVRGTASLDGPVVTTLPPGMPVFVQPASGEWWTVKPRSGNAFHGYLRRDRFVVE